MRLLKQSFGEPFGTYLRREIPHTGQTRGPYFLRKLSFLKGHFREFELFISMQFDLSILLYKKALKWPTEAQKGLVSPKRHNKGIMRHKLTRYAQKGSWKLGPMRSLPGDCFLGRGFDIDFFYQYQPDSAPCCKLLFTLLTPFTLLAPLNTVKNSFGAKKLYLIWLYGFMGFRAKSRMDGELDGIYPSLLQLPDHMHTCTIHSKRQKSFICQYKSRSNNSNGATADFEFSVGA